MVNNVTYMYFKQFLNTSVCICECQKMTSTHLLAWLESISICPLDQMFKPTTLLQLSSLTLNYHHLTLLPWVFTQIYKTFIKLPNKLLGFPKSTLNFQSGS